ncbi:hypothetical protein NQ317_002265 [Molorchus minor]|uniref:Ionotropic receptor n=1 Tax=Molorchus minor TaxID=1323400 RepID=A0ABQ9JXQ5_9CUCU|nr:hypothetical protein NQ317_002265 [Molorchus minor]
MTAAMNYRLLTNVITINIVLVVCTVLHREGPTHKKMANECLEHIIREHFHFRYEKSDENHTMLFTVILTENMSSPAFEIQENAVRSVNNLAAWFQIEVISSHDRYEFESFTECSEDNQDEDDDSCEHHAILDFKSNFYLIIVDDENSFDYALEILEYSNTFNPKALFLVYAEDNIGKYEQLAESILKKMWLRLLIRTVVLVPESLQKFKLYRLSSSTHGPYSCLSNITLAEEDVCIKGRMANIKKRYFEIKEKTNYLNCSLGVISEARSPFIINEEKGFEIDILRSIGSALNIHFNITVSHNMTDTWGAYVNDSWTGKLQLVFEDFYIGIGNIETGMSYATDFSFSRYYHMEPLVYVVPIAEYVPKWRVLVAIFSLEVWGICLGAIISFAASFYVSSKFGKEHKQYKTLSKALESSYQLIICHAISVQPTTDLTRVFFLAMNIFGIAIASAYTCSLVFYLTNPIKEHQPTDNNELLDIFGNLKYKIGGLSRYRELFNVTDNKRAYKVFREYQTAVGANDTILYWINQVGTDRDTWTISSRLFADYLLSENSSVATHPNGRSKIFVFKNQLLSYSEIGGGGLVDHMCRKYTQAIKKRKSLDDGEDDSIRPLSVDHLQSVFAVLVLGYMLGSVFLTLELIYYKLVAKKQNKIRICKKTV